MSEDATINTNEYSDITSSTELSQIQSTFSGSTVFLTGSTGFLGKLLIEKLLRTCSDLKKLYVLMRPKKNKTVTERIQQQFNDPIYDTLRKKYPDFTEKIKIVEGDVSVGDLGISDKDKSEIAEEVEFIFHGAATVKFDEILKKATEINIRGSREMIKLAKNCQKLRAYVHISTAYCNCLERVIEEKLYDVPLDPEKVVNLVEHFDESFLTEITPMVLGKYPNTYAFTKSTAERMVDKYSEGLPVAIYRPAIVASTAKEPVPGWIDNIYGPTGIILGSAVGILRVLCLDANTSADIIPADMAVNACLAVAWKTARDSSRKKELAPYFDKNPTVYNHVSSIEKPLIWNDVRKYTYFYGRNIPLKCAFWYPMLLFPKNYFLYSILFFLLHSIPAYIADAVAVLIGKEPVLTNVYTKIKKHSTLIKKFNKREMKFTNTNIQNLYQELCDTDKKMYDFNMAALNWDEYFQSYITGIRLYIAKETPDTVPEALRKHKILRFLHYSFIAVLFLTLCWIINYILFRLF